MVRLVAVALTVLALGFPGHAHFVFLLPSSDGSTLKAVMSDSLAVDEEIDAAKIANTKLFVRGTDGKDMTLTCKAAAHHLAAAIPGKGARLVFGTTDYGVMQRGDAKPFQLKYHAKAIVGPLTTANAKVGAGLPVEIIPVVDGGKLRLQFVVKGKPLSDVEVNVMLPGEKNEKVKTDADGFTKWFAGDGRYGAWARHTELAAGEANGKKFDEVRHYATLVVDVNK